MTPRATPTTLSRGARVFLGALLAVALSTGTARYFFPVGDPYVASMPPGGADFCVPFNSARALLRGIDPYHNEVPEFDDPWGRRDGVVPDGPPFRSFYPPSHFVLDVPFVIASRGDLATGARLFFAVTLGAIVGLAAVTVRLAQRLRALPAGDFRWLLGGALTLTLAASPGVMLGLERGQSETLLSACAWGGALLVLEGRAGLGIFLVSAAVLCKGYAVLAGAGLLALALVDRTTRRGAVLGVVAAAVAFLLPVAHLLLEGRRAIAARSNMFFPVPYNHGFKNLAFWLDPALADGGRVALMLVALGATALCFAGAWRNRAASGEARAAWLVLFMSAAHATMLGWSALSCSYNIVYVLPGAFVVGLASEQLAGRTGVSARVLPLLATAAGACLSLPRMSGPNVPIAGIGLVVLVALTGLCGASALREVPLAPAAAPDTADLLQGGAPP